MKTIRVSEATNTQLDWLVAKALGAEGAMLKHLFHYRPDFHPTTNPAQMWPTIDRERISIRFWDNTQDVHAYMPNSDAAWSEGPTALIAAARCFVASKLGDVVEVPEELT